MVGLGFLFSLPHSFFETAECIGAAGQATDAKLLTAEIGDRDGRATATAENDDAEGPAATSSTPQRDWNESGATCIACGIGTTSQGFTSSAEQRQHFKTDWHRYNLKRRLDKKPPVTEQEFVAMIEQGDDVSSISGSDTESSEDEDSDNESAAAGGRKGQALAAIQGAQAVFRNADGTAFAVWRCLLLPDAHKHKQQDPNPQQLLQLLRQLRKAPDSSSSSSSNAAVTGRGGSSSSSTSEQPVNACGCLWTLLMLRGGHFAAAVFKINSSSSSSSSGAAAAAAVLGSSQQQQQRPRVQQAAAEPFQVVAHKTFHRYVVRAKAGGKQSTKDATGKFARSAGSRLRRYNEAALQRDITQLLKDWSPYLSASQLIFLAAPGSNARVVFTAAADAQTLVGGSGAQGLGFSPSGQYQQGLGVLDPADLRVRRVPFVTQRPTFSELKRVLLVLGSVRQAQIAASSEPEQQQQQQQQGGQQQQHSQVKPGSSSSVEAVPTAAVSNVQISKKVEDPPLIKAAKAGDADRVARLLSNGHDPTARDSKGRTPYVLAANKEVRDAFRRFMAQHPEAWDYSSSDIPSPLTDEMENKKADKKARQKAKEKERKQAAAAAAGGGSAGSSSSIKAAAAAAAGDSFDDELAAAMAEAAAISSRSSSKSKKVGGPTSAAASKAAAAKVEEAAKRREQLAAAAEARLKALQQKQQLW